MRELVLQRFGEFEAELGPKLLREFIAELVGRWQKAGRLLGSRCAEADIDRLAAQLQKEFAPILSAGPGQEDVNRLIQQIAEKLAGGEEGGTQSRSAHRQVRPALRGLSRPCRSRWGSNGPRCSPRCGTSSKTARPALARRGPPDRSRNLRPGRGGLRPVCHRGTPQSWPTKRAFGRETEPGTSSAQSQRRNERTDLQSLRAELDAAWSPHLFLWQKSKDDLLEGNGQRGAHARLGQYLDAADHQSHRHAGHRRADHDRREGLRQRPGPDPGGVRPGRRGAAADSRRGGRVSRPESAARATWKSRSTATGRPATASTSATFRT